MMAFEPSRGTYLHGPKRDEIDLCFSQPMTTTKIDQSASFAPLQNIGATMCSQETCIHTEDYNNPMDALSLEYNWPAGIEVPETMMDNHLRLAEHDSDILRDFDANNSTRAGIDYGIAPLADDYLSDGNFPDMPLDFVVPNSSSTPFGELSLSEQLTGYADSINNLNSYYEPQIDVLEGLGIGLLPQSAPFPNSSLADIQPHPSIPDFHMENDIIKYNTGLGMGVITSRELLQYDEAPQMAYTTTTVKPSMDALLPLRAHFQVPSFDLASPLDPYTDWYSPRSGEAQQHPQVSTTSWTPATSAANHQLQNHLVNVTNLGAPTSNNQARSITRDRKGPPSTFFGPPRPANPASTLNTSLKPQSKKRTRKTFSEEGKKKVKLVRDNGACFSCRYRKISCSLGIVCDSCKRLASEPSLATQICLRNRLKDIFRSVKDLHESLHDRKVRLDPLLTSLIGDAKHVSLSVMGEGSRAVAELRLQVMRCSSSSFCFWKRLEKVSGIYVTWDSILAERYVIVPSSLPSIDELNRFGRQILSRSSGSHSGNITQYLDVFLLRYSKGTPVSRLRKLVNSTLTIASLNRIVAHGFINLHDGSYDLLKRLPTNGRPGERFVSETVYDQLRLLAAEGLEQVEKPTFSEIDELSKIVKSSPHGRIVAGVCLLRLIVLYRDRLVRDTIRLELPSNGRRHQTRLENARFMYNRLTVAFGALCQAKNTPLTLGWVSENEQDDVGDDAALRVSFSKLESAFNEFCKDKLSDQYDNVFRGLIVESTRKPQA